MPQRRSGGSNLVAGPQPAATDARVPPPRWAPAHSRRFPQDRAALGAPDARAPTSTLLTSRGGGGHARARRRVTPRAARRTRRHPTPRPPRPGSGAFAQLLATLSLTEAWRRLYASRCRGGQTIGTLTIPGHRPPAMVVASPAPPAAGRQTLPPQPACRPAPATASGPGAPSLTTGPPAGAASTGSSASTFSDRNTTGPWAPAPAMT